MNKSLSLLLVLLLIASSVTVLEPVRAESRTIVVPDDYPTISSAINNAIDGNKIFIRNGTYQEKMLVINKKISLIGEDAKLTKINVTTPRHIEKVNNRDYWYTSFDPAITVNADDFKLSGLTITSTGGKISITGNRTQTTGNNITADLFISGSHVDISENTLSSYNVLNGVQVSGDCCNISANNIIGPLLVIGQNNIISFNNVKGDLKVAGTSCYIYNNNLNSNPFGAFSVVGNDTIVCKNVVDNFAAGLTVSGSNNNVFLNQITNCRLGLCPRAGSTFYANYVANNAWGVDTSDTAINPMANASTLFHNNFVNNINQVSNDFTPNETDYFDNGKEGNYWSDYQGKDANGDGIGDTTYVIDSNRSDRYPLMLPFNLSSVPEVLPDWMLPPAVHMISPEKTTYTSVNVTLEFTINKQASWTGYSLDRNENVTLTGNTTLTALSTGLHNVTVYAKDEFGNTGASETISFHIQESFPVIPVATVSVAAIAVVVGAGLLVYFKKRKR